MIECYATGVSDKPAVSSVSLNFEQRQKSRGRATMENGDDVAWYLPRATVLADGDCLITKDGQSIQVIAAAETLSEVYCEQALLLARAAYHLGNRHVPLQITASVISYQHDHVLDAMVEGLGLKVVCVDKPFHPESGAYHSHASHAHQPDHDHHNHEHNHEH
jgi:urease accessory protein